MSFCRENLWSKLQTAAWDTVWGVRLRRVESNCLDEIGNVREIFDSSSNKYSSTWSSILWQSSTASIVAPFSPTKSAVRRSSRWICISSCDSRELYLLLKWSWPYSVISASRSFVFATFREYCSAYSSQPEYSPKHRPFWQRLLKGRRRIFLNVHW